MNARRADDSDAPRRAPSTAGDALPAALAVIPARLGSTRLSRKALLAETGLPLVVHTARAAAASGAFGRVVVATDHGDVLEACRAHGVEAELTRADHPSGLDRVHEVAARICDLGVAFEVVVDVQGDEPESDGAALRALVAAFRDPAIEAATLATPLADPAEFALPTLAKVVVDARGDALYFSRAPIPCAAHARPGAPVGPSLRHVGAYAFRPAALARFCALAPGPLEGVENLEQLRWLEAGGRMRVVLCTHAPHGIDTRAQYDAFVARWRVREGSETSEEGAMAREAAR